MLVRLSGSSSEAAHWPCRVPSLFGEGPIEVGDPARSQPFQESRLPSEKAAVD